MDMKDFKSKAIACNDEQDADNLCFQWLSDYCDEINGFKGIQIKEILKHIRLLMEDLS